MAITGFPTGVENMGGGALQNLMGGIVRTTPFLKDEGGVNFNYLSWRVESEILKKGWKYGTGLGLLRIYI